MPSCQCGRRVRRNLTDSTADVTCETQPSNGAPVFESTHTGTRGRGYAGRRNSNRTVPDSEVIYDSQIADSVSGEPRNRFACV